MARTALIVTVAGRVQGVGFRAFVTREATTLNLDGWVRNRRDGSVEILAIGDGDAIHHLVARCRKGPRLAEIIGVTMRDAADDGTTGFRQHPTS
jgi:acylphosphatase